MRYYGPVTPTPSDRFTVQVGKVVYPDCTHAEALEIAKRVEEYWEEYPQSGVPFPIVEVLIQGDKNRWP